jgi:hypothetical protein
MLRRVRPACLTIAGLARCQQARPSEWRSESPALCTGEECIVVSVKGTDGEPKTEENLKLWLKKKCWAGSQAAKAGIQRLNIRFNAENLWGERRDFAAGSLQAQSWLCVLECSQEPFKEIEFEITQPESPVQIHVLSANDLLNTTLWIGSVWDVFQHFDKRAAIRNTFTAINGERFPLASYVLKAHDSEHGFNSTCSTTLGLTFLRSAAVVVVSSWFAHDPRRADFRGPTRLPPAPCPSGRRFARRWQTLPGISYLLSLPSLRRARPNPRGVSGWATFALRSASRA